MNTFQVFEHDLLCTKSKFITIYIHRKPRLLMQLQPGFILLH